MFLLTLSTFKFTGGIEKFNQCFLKAIQELFPTETITAWSLYDSIPDARYINNAKFRGFDRSKANFVLAAVWEARKYNTIFIGHINLAILVVLIRFFYPKKKIILFAHGIEVWDLQKGLKARALKKLTSIWAVSTFTKNELCKNNDLDCRKVQVFPNTIDPFFEANIEHAIDWDLLLPYNLNHSHTIIFTLTRLKATEMYKGYDKIIAALPNLIKLYPNLKYVLAGKYDKQEYHRIKELASYYNVTYHVEILGYVASEVLINLYKAAQLFTMPSSGEGFGIVFLEAMAMGLPVIAGNADGSVDALDHGRLGRLVNPHDIQGITTVLKEQLEAGKGSIIEQQLLQTQVYALFGFEQFKKRLYHLIHSLS